MCRQCYGRCALFGHVKDGRLTKIEGNPDLFSEGTLCGRAFAIPQELYNPLRVRYPQKRVGEKGSGQWKRITWEEAYQEAADRYHVSVMTLRRRIRSGALPAVHAGRRLIRIPAAALEQLFTPVPNSTWWTS